MVKTKGSRKGYAVQVKNRCKMDGCKKERCAKTSLCLTHLARRTGLNKLTLEEYDRQTKELTKKFTGRGFEGKIVK